MSNLVVKQRPWKGDPLSKELKYQCNCKSKTLRRKVHIRKSNQTSVTDGNPLFYQQAKTKASAAFDTYLTRKQIIMFQMLASLPLGITELKELEELEELTRKQRIMFQMLVGLPFDITELTRKQRIMFRTLVGLPFEVTDSKEQLKTFQIRYKSPLSLMGQTILTSFTDKYIYYAMDDLLYLLDSNPTERDNLLAVLYSSMLSLHNDLSVNFFDIWINSIYINENYSTNRFLINKNENFNQTTETIITLKLKYFKRAVVKKPEPLW